MRFGTQLKRIHLECVKSFLLINVLLILALSKIYVEVKSNLICCVYMWGRAKVTLFGRLFGIINTRKNLRKSNMRIKEIKHHKGLKSLLRLRHSSWVTLSTGKCMSVLELVLKLIIKHNLHSIPWRYVWWGVPHGGYVWWSLMSAIQ